MYVQFLWCHKRFHHFSLAQQRDNHLERSKEEIVLTGLWLVQAGRVQWKVITDLTGTEHNLQQKEIGKEMWDSVENLVYTGLWKAILFTEMRFMEKWIIYGDICWVTNYLLNAKWEWAVTGKINILIFNASWNASVIFPCFKILEIQESPSNFKNV